MPEAVEVPPADESSPQEALPVKPEANKGASSPHWVLETTQGILERIHASRLQALYEMGSMRELDRTLSHALMAEFARVQLVMGKDLTKSLIALHLELENTSQAFLSDISKVLNLQSIDPAAYEVKAHLHKIHQALTIKMHLPLLELQAAREELEVFLQRRLQEIGLSPPSATGFPVSAREGISRQWASTVREAVLKTEGRVLHARLVTPNILPPGLWLDRDPGLDSRELDVMAPVLTPALVHERKAFRGI